MNETADTSRYFQPVASACTGQWLYLLDDEGVVYSETQNRFAGLDAAGVSAYRAFDAGASPQDLRKFRDAQNPSSASEDALEAIHALSQGTFPAEDSRMEWPVLDYPATANIEINGIPVLLEYPIGPLEDLCRDYFRNCAASVQPATCHVYARHMEDGWAIYVNGCELLSALREEQLGLGFLHAARSLLYAEAAYDVAFHAALVADGDYGVMLCAPRESGKSTLAAYLLAQGFELLADEPALLHLDTCCVSSLCLPVSLKEGSWAVLQHVWPQLAAAPIHARSDGTKIRLLHAPEAHRSGLPRRLTHIVFPEYCPSSVAHAERLSPLRTLGLLNEGGMILAQHMTRDAFEPFLRLVCITPTYVVRYASLEEAGRMIQQLTKESG